MYCYKTTINMKLYDIDQKIECAQYCNTNKDYYV